MKSLGIWLVVGLAMAGLVGCRKAVEPQQQSYSLRGKIVAVAAADGMVTVNHQAIPGLMEAMTMPYKLAAPETASELHVGDVITARVLAEHDAAGPLHMRLDHVVVVGQARPDTVPKIQYHVPAVGDAVPDFHLVDQSGKRIELKQFKGRAVLMTFIYTRCPLADFCPRMSGNFAEIDKALAEDKKAYGKTHLLSVSFDPKYDTPAVLRSYGGAHTGRFTQEDFKHWSFAAPSLADLQGMEQWFDVGVTGDTSDPANIMHSLSTILIGEDGRVVAWYPTYDWKVADVLGALKQAAV